VHALLVSFFVLDSHVECSIELVHWQSLYTPVVARLVF
jgi:hypothetical protein